MPVLMRPGFHGAYHHLTLPYATGRPERVFDVVGSLCENTDRCAVHRALPEPHEGDIALLHGTGAHGRAMGFAYPELTVVLLQLGELRLELRPAAGFFLCQPVPGDEAAARRLWRKQALVVLPGR